MVEGGVWKDGAPPGVRERTVTEERSCLCHKAISNSRDGLVRDELGKAGRGAVVPVLLGVILSDAGFRGGVTELGHEDGHQQGPGRRQAADAQFDTGASLQLRMIASEKHACMEGQGVDFLEGV